MPNRQVVRNVKKLQEIRARSLISTVSGHFMHSMQNAQKLKEIRV